MKIKKLAISIIFSLFILSATAYAENIYVDSSSTGVGNGTQSSPYQTISEAQTAVRSKNDNMKEDINVILSGGVYNLDEPLEFMAEDSGTNRFSVNYKAAEGATPIISGGKTVTGWTVHDSEKNIWKA